MGSTTSNPTRELIQENKGNRKLPKLTTANFPNADEIVRQGLLEEDKVEAVDILLVNPPTPDGGIWIRTQHRVGRRSRENMHRLYTLLFALSIALINPWGGSRGEIWTLPKVGVVLFLVVTNGILLWEASDRWRLSRVWRRGLLLWGLFLGLGLLSTVHSPFPWRSFWGQDEMGDGWLYWLLLAGFALSNALVLRVYPTLFQAQVQGVLIGGGVLALSVLPQALDWTLDYTATTGQLLQENVLASTVFDNHQPIGLYSHRGHVDINQNQVWGKFDQGLHHVQGIGHH